MQDNVDEDEQEDEYQHNMQVIFVANKCESTKGRVNFFFFMIIQRIETRWKGDRSLFIFIVFGIDTWDYAHHENTGIVIQRINCISIEMFHRLRLMFRSLKSSSRLPHPTHSVYEFLQSSFFFFLRTNYPIPKVYDFFFYGVKNTKNVGLVALKTISILFFVFFFADAFKNKGRGGGPGVHSFHIR